jgi:hypothetical protein
MVPALFRTRRLISLDEQRTLEECLMTLTRFPLVLAGHGARSPHKRWGMGHCSLTVRRGKVQVIAQSETLFARSGPGLEFVKDVGGADASH